MSEKQTFGLLVGSRGFFPGHLARSGREQMIGILEGAGYEVTHGAVQSREDAKKCAELFKKAAGRISGVILTLPNFGEEKAIAEALRMADLRVPVLVHAFPDTAGKMTIADRRDSFCGKMSACNNLSQYRIPYSLTTLHTEAPDSAVFTKDLAWFAAVCRVVKGLRSLRIGAIGARPTAFNTVRYSEKILEGAGIAVEPIDLSEIFGRIGRLKDEDAGVQAKLKAIQAYVSTTGIPAEALIKMSKLGVVIDGWMQENDLDISAIQCWTSMEEYFGVVPCTVMRMHALRLASQTPSALLDWNNNYGEDPNKAVCFHCSNLPKHFFADVRMDYQEIIAGTVGKLNTFGTCVGRVKSGPMSYARFSTDDDTGEIRGYVGEGRFTDDPLNTFGGAGVVEIPRLQDLLHFICEQGFEHHVAANFSETAGAVYEAAAKYLGWEVYWHR
jgi:L-fucose isomerase-like protein